LPLPLPQQGLPPSQCPVALAKAKAKAKAVVGTRRRRQGENERASALRGGKEGARGLDRPQPRSFLGRAKTKGAAASAACDEKIAPAAVKV
jgi:hypothetical protein